VPRRAPVLVLVLGLLLGLTLAACTAPPAGTPTPNPPAPVVSPTRAEAPEPRVGTTCAHLLGVDELQRLLLAPIRVQTDETRIDDFGGAVLRQAGGIRCAWGGDDRTDTTYDTGLTLSLLPDAEGDYARYRSSQYFEGDAAGTGPTSGIHCDSSAPICGGEVLVGTTWLSFTYSDKGRASDLTPTVVDLVTRMASRIGKPTGSAWSPPTGSLDRLPCTGAAGTTLIGRTAVASAPEEETGTVLFDAVAARHANVSVCSWSTGDGGPTATLQLLPGGGWAFDPLAASGATWPLIGVPLRSASPGTDGALHACGDTCEAAVSVQRSLVAFDSFPPDAAGFDAQLARLGGVLAG